MYATTNLATFKAIVKKYPQIARETVLRDLVASQPALDGKWFAAAKDAGLFELAIELANRSASNRRTLTRAARDYAIKQPEFALAAGMTALRGIASGWGYEMTGEDVLAAYAATVEAPGVAGMNQASIAADVGSWWRRMAKAARSLSARWGGLWKFDRLPICLCSIR
jgi:hypothetical protein